MLNYYVRVVVCAWILQWNFYHKRLLRHSPLSSYKNSCIGHRSVQYR